MSRVIWGLLRVTLNGCIMTLTATQRQFVCKGEPSQLLESLNELPDHRKPSELDDLLSSLGETPQLSGLQHSVSELPAHSANDTELHPAVTSGDLGKAVHPSKAY